MTLRRCWLLLTAFPLATAAAADPQFSQPVACTLGKDCFIQYYVDADMTAGAKDYTCGPLSADGFKGTGFRLRNTVAMDVGVDVLAAAPGVVLRTRDGMPDISVVEAGADAVRNREGGNGLVIDHGDGWVTQYSHLKKGSVAVKPGQSVEAGQRLGQIGLSGNTNFPHLEFAVRHDDQPVDPFSGAPAGAGCGLENHPLWADDLAYVPSGLLSDGFALERPKPETARHGGYATTELTIYSPRLYFWIDVFGLQAGDHVIMQLIGTDSVVLAERDTRIDSARWQFFAFADGRPRDGWKSGFYLGKLQVVRGDEIVVQASNQIALP